MSGHHFAQIAYLIIPIAFLVKSPEKFQLSWKLIRFWVCLLYFTGGLYKIYYGGFAFDDNMAEILRGMNAEIMFLKPGSMRGDMTSFLVSHPGFAQLFYRFATVLDLVMIIGLFTYRFDRWLLLSLLLFHVFNYLILHISFVEQSLIFAPFLPWQSIANRIVNTNNNDRPE